MVAFVAFIPHLMMMTCTTASRKINKPARHAVPAMLSFDDRQMAAQLSDLLLGGAGGPGRLCLARGDGYAIALSPALVRVLETVAEMVDTHGSRLLGAVTYMIPGLRDALAEQREQEQKKAEAQKAPDPRSDAQKDAQKKADAARDADAAAEALAAHILKGADVAALAPAA